MSTFNFNLKTKDLTLMTGGRRLVDRACVYEIPKLVDEPVVVVVAKKIADSLMMRNDADPSPHLQMGHHNGLGLPMSHDQPSENIT